MTIAVGVFRVLEQLKTDIFIEKESVLKILFQNVFLVHFKFRKGEKFELENINVFFRKKRYIINFLKMNKLKN